MTSGEIAYLVWNDLVGISRTRGVPAKDLSNFCQHGVGWAMAGQALTPFEDIAPNPWGPMDEVRQVPDMATELCLQLGADRPPLHLVLCDSLHNDGSPWECCTRSMLKAALAELKDRTGFELQIAYETEFMIEGEGLRWATPFSMDSARLPAKFLDRLAAALVEADLGLETIEPEYGVGQYEVSCGPAVGLAGADRAVLTREVLREVGRQEGYFVTLSPKPAPEAVGNGCHLHFSFVDAGGRPAAYDAAGQGELSGPAAQFVAGIQRHLAALTALTAPSPVSYLRLGAHHWSCGYDVVGVQNREAAIRICPSPVADPDRRGQAFNIEFRATDATASPYLAIAAIVRAGLDGIVNNLPLPPLMDQDPADLTDEERASRGINPLPATLDQALAALGENRTACGWLSPVCLQAYQDLKRYEANMFVKATAEDVCERYRNAY